MVIREPVEMARVELTPLRAWNDFFPGWDRFSRPANDFARWNNRVISNLLYYQTNYLVLAVTVFLLVGYWDPLGIFKAIMVVSLVFVASVWVGENRAAINNFKNQNPIVFVVLVLVVCYMLMSLLGSVMVFMTAITLPLTLILAHASFRLRNIKNKLENKIEFAGLKKSPMGLLLEAVGQQEETFQRIQNFLEGSLK